MTKTLLLLTAIVAMPANHRGLERPASEADLLRAFAFGRCLEKAYAKTPFGEDASQVANGYFEMGKLTRDGAYEEITKLAASVEAAKPPTVGGHNLAIMACLEFYESAKLKQIAQWASSRPKKGP
jgi:hypothetical protein